jgi:hypothetical protein
MSVSVSMSVPGWCQCHVSVSFSAHARVHVCVHVHVHMKMNMDTNTDMDTETRYEPCKHSSNLPHHCKQRSVNLSELISIVLVFLPQFRVVFCRNSVVSCGLSPRKCCKILRHSTVVKTIFENIPTSAEYRNPLPWTPYLVCRDIRILTLNLTGYEYYILLSSCQPDMCHTLMIHLPGTFFFLANEYIVGSEISCLPIRGPGRCLIN